MPLITQRFTSLYQVDTALPMTAEEFLPGYLVDIPLSGLNGEIVSYAAIEDKIRIARTMLENWLDIKICKEREYETRDFDRTQFAQYGYIRVSYPINEVNSLYGYLNFAKQITYPRGWLSLKAPNTSRNMQIMPGQDYNSATVDAYSIIYSSRSALLLGALNPDMIPNYWRIDYFAGYDQPPADLMYILGKLISIQVLNILGDITFGAGIANISLSIDGLSQSIGTTHSPENALYSARIRQYQAELKDELYAAKARYRGIAFAVV